MISKKNLSRYIKNIYLKKRKSILILLYHRVIDLKIDTRHLCISPIVFENEIQYLKAKFNIISSSDLISFFKKGGFPKLSIIITFDDGYSDNYYIASEILKKYLVPATFFITAGMIDSSREFWWDELEKILLIDFDNYKPLEIYIDNNRYFWNIKNKQDARKSYNELISLLRFINSNERTEVLEGLYNWSNKKKDRRDSHKILTKSELQGLIKSSLFDIGSHTINHCSLADLSPEEQLYEMSESKKILENISDREVISISYPYGNVNNINEYTKKIADQVGYKFGMVVMNSLIFKRSDLFLLPRHLIVGRDFNDFKKNIDLITNPDDAIDKIKMICAPKINQYTTTGVHYS